MVNGQLVEKAGVLPYMWNDILEEYEMCFMVASDPKFGGLKPMVSKGTIEPGENILKAALREAEEEIGFRQTNMKNEPFIIFDDYVKLRSCEYSLRIYAVEVIDRNDFDPVTEEETAEVMWLDRDTFQAIGRNDHKKIVDLLFDKLEK